MKRIKNTFIFILIFLILMNITNSLNAATYSIPKSVRNDKYFITINKDNLRLNIYRKGKFHSSYPVAIGKPSTPTPTHKFKIINKLVNPYWGGMGGKYPPVAGGSPRNPLGKRWMGLDTIVYRGYGIHGNNNPNSIGKRVSSGCIRMRNNDVEHIFRFIPVGTKVWIGNTRTLNNWGVKKITNKPKPIKPKEKPIIPSKQKLLIDGKVKNIEMYNIKDNNYIKIRDMGALLNDSFKPVSIKWDSKNKVITLQDGVYQYIGGELKATNKGVYPKASNVKVRYRNDINNLKGYNIDGNNYIKVRDLLDILDINIKFKNNTIYIDTKKDSKGNLDKVNQRRIVNGQLNKVRINDQLFTIRSINIDDYNYFRLRDLAYVFKDTDKSFNVKWDNHTFIEKGKYNRVEEIKKLSKDPTIAYLREEKIQIEEHIKTLVAYNVKGYNYYKLRDFMELLDVSVDYDLKNREIIISFDESKELIDDTDRTNDSFNENFNSNEVKNNYEENDNDSINIDKKNNINNEELEDEDVENESEIIN